MQPQELTIIPSLTIQWIEAMHKPCTPSKQQEPKQNNVEAPSLDLEQMNLLIDNFRLVGDTEMANLLSQWIINTMQLDYHMQETSELLRQNKIIILELEKRLSDD